MDFPLAELDDVILMGFPGLERAGEGEELPVLPGVGEEPRHRVELQGGVLPIQGRGRLNLHQQTSARYPAPKKYTSSTNEVNILVYVHVQVSCYRPGSVSFFIIST